MVGGKSFPCHPMWFLYFLFKWCKFPTHFCPWTCLTCELIAFCGCGKEKRSQRDWNSSVWQKRLKPRGLQMSQQGERKQGFEKEIEEKELEEAKVLLVEAEKWKCKKGKKATRDGVSSFCNWLSFWWMLMIARLWHVYHLFLLLSPAHRVYIPLFFHPVGVNRPWWDGWMIKQMDGWMMGHMNEMMFHDVLYYMYYSTNTILMKVVQLSTPNLLFSPLLWKP